MQGICACNQGFPPFGSFGYVAYPPHIATGPHISKAFDTIIKNDTDDPITVYYAAVGCFSPTYIIPISCRKVTLDPDEKDKQRWSFTKYESIFIQRPDGNYCGISVADDEKLPYTREYKISDIISFVDKTPGTCFPFPSLLKLSALAAKTLFETLPRLVAVFI